MTQDELKIKIAELYKHAVKSRFYVSQRWWMIPFEYLESQLPKQGVIADIGCGYGLMSNYLALSSSDRKIIGIDISEKRIEFAKKSLIANQNIEFKCLDVRKFDYQESVDGVIMIDFLHHIDYDLQVEVLKKVYSILKKQGTLVIKEVDDKPIIKCIITWIFECVFYPFDVYCFRNSREYKKLLTELGFVVESIEPKHKGNPLFSTVVYKCRKI